MKTPYEIAAACVPVQVISYKLHDLSEKGVKQNFEQIKKLNSQLSLELEKLEKFFTES